MIEMSEVLAFLFPQALIIIKMSNDISKMMYKTCGRTLMYMEYTHHYVSPIESYTARFIHKIRWIV